MATNFQVAPSLREAADFSVERARAKNMWAPMRNYMATRAGTDMNAALADEANARALGRDEDAALAAKRAAHFGQKQSLYAPQVGRVEDIRSFGDALSWAGAQAGGFAGSVQDPLAMGVGGQLVGTAAHLLSRGRAGGLMGLSKAAPVAGIGAGAIYSHDQAMGEMYGRLKEDPQALQNMTPQEAASLSNSYGLGAAALGMAAPTMLSRQLGGAALQSGAARRAAGVQTPLPGMGSNILRTMGVEGGSELAEGKLQQAAHTYANPLRDRSGDFSEDLNNFAAGAVGAGGPAAVGAGANAMWSGADRMRDPQYQQEVADLVRGTATDLRTGAVDAARSAVKGGKEAAQTVRGKAYDLRDKVAEKYNEAKEDGKFERAEARIVDTIMDSPAAFAETISNAKEKANKVRQAAQRFSDRHDLPKRTRGAKERVFKAVLGDPEEVRQRFERDRQLMSDAGLDETFPAAMDEAAAPSVTDSPEEFLQWEAERGPRIAKALDVLAVSGDLEAQRLAEEMAQQDPDSPAADQLQRQSAEYLQGVYAAHQMQSAADGLNLAVGMYGERAGRFAAKAATTAASVVTPAVQGAVRGATQVTGAALRGAARGAAQGVRGERFNKQGTSQGPTNPEFDYDTWRAMVDEDRNMPDAKRASRIQAAEEGASAFKQLRAREEGKASTAEVRAAKERSMRRAVLFSEMLLAEKNERFKAHRAGEGMDNWVRSIGFELSDIVGAIEEQQRTGKGSPDQHIVKLQGIADDIGKTLGLSQIRFANSGAATRLLDMYGRMAAAAEGTSPGVAAAFEYITEQLSNELRMDPQERKNRERALADRLMGWLPADMQREVLGMGKDAGPGQLLNFMRQVARKRPREGIDEFEARVGRENFHEMLRAINADDELNARALLQEELVDDSGYREAATLESDSLDMDAPVSDFEKRQAERATNDGRGSSVLSYAKEPGHQARVGSGRRTARPFEKERSEIKGRDASEGEGTSQTSSAAQLRKQINEMMDALDGPTPQPRSFSLPRERPQLYRSDEGMTAQLKQRKRDRAAGRSPQPLTGDLGARVTAMEATLSGEQTPETMLERMASELKNIKSEAERDQKRAELDKLLKVKALADGGNERAAKGLQERTREYFEDMGSEYFVDPVSARELADDAGMNEASRLKVFSDYKVREALSAYRQGDLDTARKALALSKLAGHRMSALIGSERPTTAGAQPAKAQPKGYQPDRNAERDARIKAMDAKRKAGQQLTEQEAKQDEVDQAALQASMRARADEGLGVPARRELQQAVDDFFDNNYAVRGEQVTSRSGTKMTQPEVVQLARAGRDARAAVRAAATQDMEANASDLRDLEGSMLNFEQAPGQNLLGSRQSAAAKASGRGADTTVSIPTRALVAWVRQNKREPAPDTEDGRWLNDLYEGITSLLDSGAVKGMPFVNDADGRRQYFADQRFGPEPIDPKDTNAVKAAAERRKASESVGVGGRKLREPEARVARTRNGREYAPYIGGVPQALTLPPGTRSAFARAEAVEKARKSDNRDTDGLPDEMIERLGSKDLTSAQKDVRNEVREARRKAGVAASFAAATADRSNPEAGVVEKGRMVSDAELDARREADEYVQGWDDIDEQFAPSTPDVEPRREAPQEMEMTGVHGVLRSFSNQFEDLRIRNKSFEHRMRAVAAEDASNAVAKAEERAQSVFAYMTNERGKRTGLKATGEDGKRVHLMDVDGAKTIDNIRMRLRMATGDKRGEGIVTGLHYAYPLAHVLSHQHMMEFKALIDAQQNGVRDPSAITQAQFDQLVELRRVTAAVISKVPAGPRLALARAMAKGDQRVTDMNGAKQYMAKLVEAEAQTREARAMRKAAEAEARLQAVKDGAAAAKARGKERYEQGKAAEIGPGRNVRNERREATEELKRTDPEGYARAVKQSTAALEDVALTDAEKKAASEVAAKRPKSQQSPAGGAKFNRQGTQRLAAGVADAMGTRDIMRALGFRSAPERFADVAAKLLVSPDVDAQTFVRQSAEGVSHLLMEGEGGQKLREMLSSEYWQPARMKAAARLMSQGMMRGDALAASYRELVRMALAKELSERGVAARSFTGRVMQAAKDFVSKFRQLTQSEQFADLVRNQLNALIKKTASPMDLRDNFRRVDFQGAIDSDPQSARVLAHMSKLPGSMLTGSIVLAASGPVYRNADGMLHDLDMLVSDTAEAVAHLKQAFPDAVQVYDFRTSTNKVDTFIAPPVGMKVQNMTFSNGDKGRLTGYEIAKDGTVVGRMWNDESGERKQGITGTLVDLLSESGDKPVRVHPFKVDGESFSVGLPAPGTIFSAKLSMGRNKDLLDYLRFEPEVGSKLSEQATTGVAASDFEVAQAKAYLDRVLGGQIKSEFEAFTGYSGSWLESENLLRVSTLTNAGVMDVARHEALHAFFSKFIKANPKAARVLSTLTDDPRIVRRLEALLKDEPEALAQLADGEERLAYIYQFAMAGRLRLPASPGKTLMGKIRRFLRHVFGMVTDEDRASLLLYAFEAGKMRDPSAAGRAIASTLNEGAWLRRGARLMDGVSQRAAAILQPAATILSSSPSPMVRAIGDLMYTNPGREADGERAPGYLNDRNQQMRRFENLYREVIEGLDDVTARETLEAMQRETPLDKIADKDVAAAVDRLRGFFARMHRYLSEEKGMRIGNLGETYFPRVLDHDMLLEDSQPFEDMLLREYRESLEGMARTWNERKNKQEGGSKEPDYDAYTVAAALVHRITSSDGVDDPTLTSPMREDGVLRPWMSAGEERSLAFVSSEHMAPFLNKNLVATLSRYVRQAVRTGEYSQRFGRFGLKLDSMLEQSRDELEYISRVMLEEGEFSSEAARGKWVDRQYRDVSNAVGAMEGSLGAGVSKTVRQLNSWATVYQNVRLLPLALFSSFVDPLGIVARGGEMKGAYDAFLRGIKSVGHQWADMLRDGPSDRDKDRWEYLAEVAGVIDENTFNQLLNDEYGSTYHVGAARKTNEMMFKLNGLDAWNRSMRVSATKQAVKFIEKHSKGVSEHSARWMKELGLKDSDIYRDTDGELITDKRALMINNPELSLSEAEAITTKTHQAINRWVEGAIMSPNAAQRPAWASDPHYGVFWHLKQFAYSFHETIMRRAMGEALNHGNAAPLGVLLWYVPVMIASDVVKGLAVGAGDLPNYMKGYDMGDWLQHGVDRSGILGKYHLAIDAINDPAGVPGPMFDQVIDIITEPTSRTAIDALPAHAVYERML